MNCVNLLAIKALDLINRQQAEIDGLQQTVSLSIDTQNEFSDTITEQKSKIEMLESRNNFLEIEYKNQGNLFWERVEGAKSEAIKKFAEKLIFQIVNRPSKKASDSVFYMSGKVDRQNEIIDIIKEMVGDEK